jgi:hypothetical protein
MMRQTGGYSSDLEKSKSVKKTLETKVAEQGRPTVILMAPALT